MKRICPNPMPWKEVFERLSGYAQSHNCIPPYPPKPLILAGWVYSSDTEKLIRWEAMISWAVNNGCSNLVEEIPDEDFYYVENLTI